jgi:hypothetical protein
MHPFSFIMARVLNPDILRRGMVTDSFVTKPVWQFSVKSASKRRRFGQGARQTGRIAMTEKVSTMLFSVSSVAFVRVESGAFGASVPSL